jgi:hypothetical protein
MKIFFCFLSVFIISHFIAEEIYGQDSFEKENVKVSLEKLNDLSFGSINSGWKTSIQQRKEDSTSKTLDVKNPFCPSSNFKFILPESDSIDITLLDIKENVISSLYKGYLSKGHYEMNLLNSILQPGVYSVVMNLGNEKYYKKFILVK